MKNMDKAVELVHKHVINNDKIFVKCDPDVDGYCSSSMIIQFLRLINPYYETEGIDYELNFEKQHGLFFKDLANHKKDEYGLIIVPDASMTVKSAKDITNNFSCDILILDHHIIEEEDGDCYTNYCTAVNCTDGVYPNPNMCGAGVVQKFIEAYVDTYKSEQNVDVTIKDTFYDLVALASVADNVDLRGLETRFYVISGLKPEKNKSNILFELVKSEEQNIPFGSTITSHGWVIAPLINGAIRYGKPEEQVDLFRAFLGEQEEIEYQPRRKHKEDPLPPIEIHSLQQTMARVCKNIKARQDNEVRKFVRALEEEIQSKHLDENSVIFVDGTKILEKGTVTGLVANKLASKYFRPVVLLRSKDALTFGGSMRGYSQSNIESTKDLLEQAGLTVQGHKEAAGITLPKAKLEEAIKKCNEIIPLDQLTTVHQVDWQMEASSLRKEYVSLVANNYDVWGSYVPEPTFAITNLRINASQIQGYGEHNTFIRFTYNDIPFIKKYCSYDDFDNLTCEDYNHIGSNRKELNINIIGQFVLSKYEDQVYPQVKIL